MPLVETIWGKELAELQKLDAERGAAVQVVRATPPGVQPFVRFFGGNCE